ENLTHPDVDYVIRTPDPEDDNSETVNPEVESSPEAIKVDIPASEKATSEQQILKTTYETHPDHPTTSEPHTELI
ncbi:hypothetical protein A2U01_0103104, partial [Trifolium medium]|nr:hypothetical protein [Trifolium medium]